MLFLKKKQFVWLIVTKLGTVIGPGKKIIIIDFQVMYAMYVVTVVKVIKSNVKVKLLS